MVSSVLNPTWYPGLLSYPNGKKYFSVSFLFVCSFMVLLCKDFKLV